MIQTSLISVAFATVICAYVGIGQALGVFHPNYFPEAGETLIGFYATLFACSALPFPALVGIVGMIQLTWKFRKSLQSN